jgi:hypothetical protein
MLEPPRQRWGYYRERTREAHGEWLRGLSPRESLALYEGFHRFASSVRLGRDEAERLERSRWAEKVALRRKLLAAFSRLDDAPSGRRHRQDPG